MKSCLKKTISFQRAIAYKRQETDINDIRTKYLIYMNVTSQHVKNDDFVTFECYNFTLSDNIEEFL